ncbi:hypothetical protein [Streptomyces sp. 1222.5]|uniref:hypothetical protein n=1 Tax=Streptomyces sp. 1222.5 TaxID=1881026 RepID=UPI003EC0D312
MKREELLTKARRILWAAWANSAEDLGSEAAATLYGLGMLVDEGEAAELVRLRKRVDEVERQYTFDMAALQKQIDSLLAERHTTNESLADTTVALRSAEGRDGACSECGQLPEQWCPGCAKCACVEEHDAGCPQNVTPQVRKLKALLAGQRDAVGGT